MKGSHRDDLNNCNVERVLTFFTDFNHNAKKRSVSVKMLICAAFLSGWTWPHFINLTLKKNWGLFE